MPERTKEQKQRAYQAWKRWKEKVSKGALAQFHKCLCGESAIKYRNGWVCERCDTLEKQMYRPESVGSGKAYDNNTFTVAVGFDRFD